MSFNVEFTASSASDAQSILREERNHNHVPPMILDFLDYAVTSLLASNFDGFVQIKASGHLHHPEYGGSGVSWLNELKVTPLSVRKPLNLANEPITVIPRPAVAEIYQPPAPVEASNSSQVAASDEAVSDTSGALNSVTPE